jgi:hypothetical protein
MFLAIEDRARCIKTSGQFEIRLTDTTSDGARLEICSSVGRKEWLWVFRGRWFAQERYEEQLEVFDHDGRSKITVLKVESCRALLRVVTEKNGHRKKCTKTFWLIKRPEKN